MPAICFCARLASQGDADLEFSEQQVSDFATANQGDADLKFSEQQVSTTLIAASQSRLSMLLIIAFMLDQNDTVFFLFTCFA